MIKTKEWEVSGSTVHRNTGHKSNKQKYMYHGSNGIKLSQFASLPAKETLIIAISTTKLTNARLDRVVLLFINEETIY